MRLEINKKLNERHQKIIRVSMMGIGANILLAALKAVFGIISGSIAILSDAVNNLTDSASSVITIVGTKLAGRRPTPDHPFGYGRIEYITSVVIGVILILTGARVFQSSIVKIRDPQPVNYTLSVNLVITAAILIKLLLSWYTKKAGKELDSGALRASGDDARNDAFVSAVTLFSSILYMLTGILIDAWAGALISIFIIKTGIDVFIDMHGHFLGQKADQELAGIIYGHVRDCPIVEEAHDLILHDYGPDRITGSINVEVDSSLTAGEIYPVLYDLQMHLFQEHLTYIVFGIYAVDPEDEDYRKVCSILDHLLMEEPDLISYHGIYVDHSKQSIYCDIVVDFKCENPYQAADRIKDVLQESFPRFRIFINVDNLFA